MIVLQLGPYPPPHGGVQTNLVAIREYLRRRQISAPVINLTRHRRADSDEVYYPRTAVQVFKLLLTIPADIIHLHIGGHLTARLLALCLVCSSIPHRRIVLTFHSGGYPTSRSGRAAGRLSVRSFILRRFDAVIAVNAAIAALFQGMGVPAARIRIICPYVPVSLRDDIRLPEPLRAFCERHSPLLTTVGLLEPEYELALQIAALATLRQTHPNAGLVIIGSGSLEADLRHLIADAPHGDHVLLCGDVAHPITLRVLAESDLFLRTTLYDGDSISVREALQLGVPVIATDNGMRPVGVRLIPPSDSAALLQAIETVLSSSVRVRETNAPLAGEEHLEEVLHLYSDLLGRDIRPMPVL